MADPSLGSNNPFRRKSAAPISTAPLDTASPFPSPAAISRSSAFPTSSPDIIHGYQQRQHSFFDTDPRAPGAAGSSGTFGARGTGGSGTPDFEDASNDSSRSSSSRPHPTGNEFREQFMALPKSTEAPPSTTFLKPKPVKKVRVQSPPPSSPDSIDEDFEARFPSNVSGVGAAPASALAATPEPNTFADYSARGGLLDDRPVRNYEDFSSESEDSDLESDRGANNDRGRAQQGQSNAPSDVSAATWASAYTSTAPVPPPAQQQRPPPNPFQKTLGDLEPGRKSGDDAQASTGKATLDVDAFSRLLMTGQGPAPASHLSPFRGTGGAAGDAGNATDTSSASTKLSVFDTPHAAQETPRTSHEISENDDDRSGLIYAATTATPTTPQTGGPAQRNNLRKKPPPPSSRHGKLIKPQKDQKDQKERAPRAAETSGQSPIPSSPSDVNKPLPPPPSRRYATDMNDGATESIFDREAAGKVPEVDLDPEAPDDAVPSPRPPTPPNAAHSTAFSPSHPTSELGAEALVSSAAAAAVATAAVPPKKPMPAPPPRRQAAHHRPESKSAVQDRPVSGDSSPEQQQPLQKHRSPVESRRSSLDSTRSRSSSVRVTSTGAAPSASSAVNAPAPPPPRRAGHASRPSASFMSPSAASFASPPSSSAGLDHERSPPGAWLATPPALASPPLPTPTIVLPPSPPHGQQGGALDGSNSSSSNNSSLSTPHSHPLPPTATAPAAAASTSTSTSSKLAKPPPPPARNVSVRHKDHKDHKDHKEGRPAMPTPSSGAAHHHHHNQPPPPPPRQRGSSRGSIDGPPSSTALGLGGPSAATATPRQVSAESVRRNSSSHHHLSVAEEGDEEGDADKEQQQQPPAPPDTTAANDILADLDALQREVDALRGQYGKP